MNKIALAVGPLLIAVGAYLIYRGYQLSQTLGGKLTQALTDEPSQQTTEYYIGGAVCIVLGAAAGGFGFLKK